MNMLPAVFMAVPGVVIAIIGWLLRRHEGEIYHWVGLALLAFGLLIVALAVFMAVFLLPIRYESGHL